ncbi:MAG: hypothetical protein AAGD11_07325 [Planctomycetota bacterium]
MPPKRSLRPTAILRRLAEAFAAIAIRTPVTLLLTCIASAAHGTLIIEDTFSRTGPLVGSLADTGQTWTGSSAFVTNGAELNVINNTGPSIGGLAFLPNQTYELSMDLTVSSGGNGWIAFGYTDTSQSNAFDANRGAVLHRQVAEIQTFAAGNTGAQSLSVTSSFPKSLAIALETGASLATSTLTFKVDGSAVSSRPADVSSIDGVFIQANGATGTVDNFRLSVVPEPSSFALISLVAVRILAGHRVPRAAMR